MSEFQFLLIFCRRGRGGGDSYSDLYFNISFLVYFSSLFLHHLLLISVYENTIPLSHFFVCSNIGSGTFPSHLNITFYNQNYILLFDPKQN